MSERGKRILLGVLGALAVGAVYGFFLFVAVLFTALAGWPVYLQHTLWAFGAVTLPAAMLPASGVLRSGG